MAGFFGASVAVLFGIRLSGKVALMFSGGKDSRVLIELTFRASRPQQRHVLVEKGLMHGKSHRSIGLDGAMDVWDALGKLVPVGKVYDDALSGPAKQIGKLGTDALKTLRLMLLPIQLGAAFQDRAEAMCDRIGKRVPEERRVPPPLEVVGPAMEKLRYAEENSALSDMFEEVLTKAMDSQAQGQVHPAFVHIISHLSRDEAWMLYRLKDQEFAVVDYLDYDRHQRKFFNRVVESTELPKHELVLPDFVELQFSHLDSLNLVTWPVHKQDPVHAVSGGPQTGIRRHSKMMLTDFGKLFVRACIPEEGFEKHAKAQ